MNKQLLNQKILESRKSGDKVALLAYQYVLSAVQASESRENKELTSDEIEKVAEKEVKALKEIVAFGNFKNNEDKMITILEKLLPEKIPVDKYAEIVDSCIIEVDAKSSKDMGRVMGAIKKNFGNKIDGKIISEIVKNKLN